MNIIYNGTDITSSVHPVSIQITDNAGGKPDSLSVVFSDANGIWSKWRPAKNDTIQIRENGFDTGVMYVDQLVQTAGRFGIMALSIPQQSKTARSQGWENVRFLEFATQIASRYGFKLRAYDVTNHLYERVDQREEPDFAFLAYRCMLEGYALKINNRTVVIYDEAKQEQKAVDPKRGVIRESDINGAFEFIDKSTDIYEKCVVRSLTPGGYIEGEFQAPGVRGPTLKRNDYAASQAEAIRWARGILRNYNKHMVTGTMTINLNTHYAAGTVVAVQDIGMFDGKYIIDRLVHDLLNNRSKLWLRRPLEGY